LIVALLLGACLLVFGAPRGFAAESLLHKQAPEFARKDLHGGTIRLGSLRGKVVLLNFWATWCAPCQLEMPRFVQWQQQYGPQSLQVIGISMDDDPALVRRVDRKLKLNYPVAMGDEELGELYGGVLGLPLTFLIDRNGEVRAQFQGETDLKTIEDRLKQILSEP
jgi:cytochrome c biogenesis protein CcmG/thiol:disulfide interchange protein DsbE